MNNSFSEGLKVRYKCHTGYIRFVCDEYLTLCLNRNQNRMRDVCLLIYPEQWKDIELIGGNRNSDEDK